MPATGRAQQVDHTPWDGMLRAYVTDGMVDYDAFALDARRAGR